MYKSQLDLTPGTEIRLPACDNLDVDESCHIIDEDSLLAINATLATARPLLVRGEPGVGKSQLARAAAVALGRAFVPHAIDARTETRDLLWSVDAVARLAEAQLVGALRKVNHATLEKRLAIDSFVHPGPLWWAFDWESALVQANRLKLSIPTTPKDWVPADGVVVLLDEIDKADPSVPNGLLDAFGHGRFDVPGRKPVRMNAACRPLVVITTNEERALPDAFLRRCFVLHLKFPSDHAELIRRGRAHFPKTKCSDAVLKEAAKLLTADREKLRNTDLCPPGLAEYLDLVRAVCGQKKTDTEQRELMAKIAKFALSKHPADRPG